MCEYDWSNKDLYMASASTGKHDLGFGMGGMTLRERHFAFSL